MLNIGLPTRLRSFTAYPIALIGALLFWAVGLPLPFLLGPLFACLLAALARIEMAGIGRLAPATRTILGVAIGASITPAVIDRLPEIGISLSLIPLFVIIIAMIGYPWFRRVCAFDHATSYYAAMPGGLQDMLLFGEEAGADPRVLSLVHATRVLVVVTLMPILLQLVFGFDLTEAPGLSDQPVPLGEILIMVACALVGWKGGEAIGLFGASILGPLIVTAIVSLAGLIHHRPPSEMIVLAQYFIGVSIGIRYAGITIEEIRRVVVASLAYCLLLGLISLGFALTVVQLGLAPIEDALMAFSPGGQAEMTVLAIVAGLDVAFIITHHLMRVVLVILLAPLAARLFRQS